MAPDALLRLEGVSKRFAGGTIGLDRVDLDIAAGEFLTLLGPSGCGKTTSLRVIAGFEAPSEGRVLLDGRDITALRPYDRPVNTVFQDYALFPHMDVAENVGFGLSLRKIAPAARRRRVGEALEMVGLADKIAARVPELSGGQRQRVALARALICEPRMLLLDEPLSALDAHLREQMQVELKGLLARLGTTFVMVTHDQTEALSISDRIAVMNKARIEQIAAPATLYDLPATKFVAGFIGTMNLLQARFAGAKEDGLRFMAGGLPLSLPVGSAGPPEPGEMATIALRPEDLAITPQPGPDTTSVRIVSSVFHGRTLRIHGMLDALTPVVIDAPRRSGVAFRAGDVVHVCVRSGAPCTILPD